MSRNKKIVAVFVVAFMVIACSLALLLTKEGKEEAGKATLEDLLASQSDRTITFMTTITAKDSAFYPLIGTPVAVYYKGNTMVASPLLVGNSDATSKFLSLYDSEITGTIGSIDVESDFKAEGDVKAASLSIATQAWESSDGAILIENNESVFGFAISAVPLASYLNIPVVVTEEIDKSVSEVLKTLHVKYTLVCGDLKGYGKIWKFESVEEIQNLTLDLLELRLGGGLEYITIANPEDITSEYGIPELSSQAPYLTAVHRGVVLSCPQPRLPEGIFENFSEEDGAEFIAQVANNASNGTIKSLRSLLNHGDDRGLLSDYLISSPYLAILGDPYSVPFYYEKGVATDDHYSDINDDITVDLATGRPIALSLESTNALICRSVFYEDYMWHWEADSTVSEVRNGEWQTNAYVGQGDDWNGAIKLMTEEFLRACYFFENNGYDVYPTRKHQNGATVAQDLLKYYTSSSYIYEMAHGSPYGYQMVDGVDSSEVKNWNMGPSTMVLISCSVGRIDVPDIENTISLTFMDVGVNAYIGGTRTEDTSGSPYICNYINEYIVVDDQPVGIALRDAKNAFFDDRGYDSGYYHFAMKELYGDPALNPYEP